MTATDELRHMLNECGVECEAECIDFSNYLTWGENDCYSYTEYPDGTVLRIWDCTPEQAIAATGEAVEIPASARMAGGTCDIPFCEQVDRWLHGDAPKECRECPDGKYGELTAMVGGGKLTADDVRDLIEHHSDEAGGNGRDFHNGAYEAIADELNAALGGWECELHDCEGSFSAVNRPVWRCDCGAFMTQYTDATTYYKPRFCPNCGRRVKGGAE